MWNHPKYPLFWNLKIIFKITPIAIKLYSQNLNTVVTMQSNSSHYSTDISWTKLSTTTKTLLNESLFPPLSHTLSKYCKTSFLANEPFIWINLNPNYNNYIPKPSSKHLAYAYDEVLIYIDQLYTNCAYIYQKSPIAKVCKKQSTNKNKNILTRTITT